MEINLEQIIQSERAWEYVLLDIVKSEELDPWNIDLVKLTETYTERIRGMKDLDLRVPARLILAAAILLRLQSEHLLSPEEEEMIEEMMDFGELSTMDEEDPYAGEVPLLDLRIRRQPERKVTLADLIKTLEKSLAPREKEEVIGKFVLDLPEVDITQKIEELYQKIIDHTDDRIHFHKLTESTSTQHIVETLMPLLHLANEQKINLEQKEFFEDLFVVPMEEVVE